jgi:hypothetical protein
MRSKIFLFLLSATLLIASSCKKESDSIRLIPKDAFMVVHIDASSLTSKLSWKEIQESAWFKKAYESEQDSLEKKMMENPENSGMDIGKDMVLYFKKQGQRSLMVFQGSVKDDEHFEKFNLAMDKNAKVTEDGKLKMMQRDGMAVVWNKDRFMFLADVPLNSSRAYYSNEPEQEFPVDSLFKFGRDLYNMEDENSLAKNEKFTGMLKEKGDLHLWVNSEEVYNSMSDQMGMLSMLKMSELIKGLVTTATFNFDNGKITMNAKQYANPKMSEIYKKLGSRKVSDELLNRIPSQNVAGVMAMSYPPELLKEFILLMGMDGMLNGMLGKMGYSMDELIRAQGGEMLVVVSDLDMSDVTTGVGMEVRPSSMYQQDEMEMDLPPSAPKKDRLHLLFSTSIGDKAAFDKLVELVKMQAGAFSMGLPPIFHHSDGKWFALGNDSAQVHSFIKGEGVKQPYASKLTGHPMSMYVDLQKIFSSLETTATTPEKKEKLGIIRNTWVDIIVYGGEFKDDYSESYGEMNFTDKGTNSLKQLNRFIEQLSAEKPLVN